LEYGTGLRGDPALDTELRLAFKGDRFIETLDHPMVARLQGVK